jgi:hypothetical protein
VYLDLLNGEVEEGVLGVHLDGRLGAHAAHGGTETTVELEHDELVEVGALVSVGHGAQLGVGDDHALGGRIDQIPVDDLAALLEEGAKDGREVGQVLGKVGLVLLRVGLAILALARVDRLDQVVHRVLDRLRDRFLRGLVEVLLRLPGTVRRSERRGRRGSGHHVCRCVVSLEICVCAI